MRTKLALAVVFSLVGAIPALAQQADQAEQLFAAPTVAERDSIATVLGGITASDQLARAHYALAAQSFFGGLERFGQALHQHGFDTPQSMMLPLLRLPVPDNPNPEPLTYEQFRTILQQLHSDMTMAAARLAEISPGEDFGIDVDLSKLGLDMNADGTIGGDESIAAIMAAMSRPQFGEQPVQSPSVQFRFDRADGIWLQGYANFLAAQADFWLAHDFRNAFDGSFHMLFPRAGLPLQDALVPKAEGAGGMLQAEWRLADLVSFIHYINWPVVEPERRQRARAELLEMIRLSRENWKAIRAETDNDREWLPGPQQKGVQPLTGLEVGEKEVKAWHNALDMAEALLNGERLLPHFRFADRGMDMKKFFEEPTPFDLVTTITGPGAVPYLAQGDLLTAEEFGRVQREFGRGGFMTFAIWFN